MGPIGELAECVGEDVLKGSLLDGDGVAVVETLGEDDICPGWDDAKSCSGI